MKPVDMAMSSEARGAARVPTATQRRSRRRSRGTTVTEVLMAISVLTIGAAGIFSLQKATVVANRQARSLDVANEISRTWLDRLRADSMKWNYPTPANPSTDDLGSDTTWLHRVDETNAWFRPANATLKVYGEHDAFGNDDPSASHEGPYCANLRLRWIGTDKNLIRAEVRVYWLRQGIQAFGDKLSIQPPALLCGDNEDVPPAVDGHGDVFHVVHAVTGIFKNMPR